MACSVCAHDYCNRNCLCWLCGDGPGCHYEDCPEDAPTEEEYARRIDLPKLEEKFRELDEAVAGMPYELELEDGSVENGVFDSLPHKVLEAPTSKRPDEEAEFPFN